MMVSRVQVGINTMLSMLMNTKVFLYINPDLKEEVYEPQNRLLAL